MLYIVYGNKTINNLKCIRCKSYSLDIRPADNPSKFDTTCLECGNLSSFSLNKLMKLESFKDWDSLNDRIDELKASFTLQNLMRD